MNSFKNNGSTSYGPVALVGAGAIAESFYLPVLRNMPGALKHLILIDANADRARDMASRFGVSRWATDYREVLADVDGAIVAVPHHLHFPIARDFLMRGAHVLSEKPLTDNAKDARELVATANENGATLSVNLTRRLAAHSQYVKQLLVEGTIGPLLSIEYLDGSEFRWPTTTGFYFDARISTKGVLLDMGSHVLDLVCWWLGRTPTLVSSLNDSFGGHEAVADVRLQADQCEVHVRLSRLAKLPNTFVLKGERGWIKGRIYDAGSVVVGSTEGGERTIRLDRSEATMSAIARRLLENFYAAIRGQGEVLTPGFEVVSSLELIDAAYERAERFPMPWYESLGVTNVSI